jgi:hypothetical protein
MSDRPEGRTKKEKVLLGVIVVFGFTMFILSYLEWVKYNA